MTTPVRIGTQLSPMQRSLLASQRRSPDAGHQNMALLSHLDGPIDASVLADAFALVAKRFDALRTRIDDVDGVAVAQVSSNAPTTERISLDRAAVAGWAAERAKHPIDLSVGPTDSVIVEHPDGTTSWYLAFHHIATDATSAALVFAAVAETYHALIEGTEPPSEQVSYYRWYRGVADAVPSKRAAKIEHFWSTRPEAPKIGRLYTAPTRPTPASRRVEIAATDRLAQAEKRLAEDLRMLSPELGWTTLMMSTAALYLHRLTGADRFAIGMPVHNRSTADARSMVGPVMDVFGVDIEIEPDDTARSLHKRIGRSVLTTLRNAELGRTAPADFETVVNVIPNMGYGSFGPIPATTTWIHPGATDPSHLLRVQLTGYGDGGMQLALDLNEAAADPEHGELAPAHFLAVLDAFLGDLDQPIGGRSIVTPDELARLVQWGTGSEPTEPAGPVIEQLRSAVSTRTDVVVESADGSDRLTGVELWQRVDARAAALTERGVRRGDRVAIEMGRSVETLITIYAVMTVGASYVPLDPAQPRVRLDTLIERAGAVLTVTESSELLRNVPSTSVDGEAEGQAEIERPAIDPDDEAYLLYTSGSTGEPKGVPITQWGLAGYVDFARSSYFVEQSAPVAALFTALTFDLTVTTLFAPLLAGGRLVVIPDDGPAAVRAIAMRPDVTWAKATPSHLDLLLRWIPADHALRTLVVGGEAFTSRLARRLWAWQPDLVLFNEYGPTEAVVGCMIHRVDPAELETTADVPIGRPAPGVRLAVLDRHRQLVPIGAVGELYISHAGVTTGYLGGAGSEAFVELGGRRWYRSGDLVRLSSGPKPEVEGSGTQLILTYLGRADEQVKVGGIRLDPSEVEQALAGHPAISVAAVRVWTPSEIIAAGAVTYCVRCGLSSRVPGTSFDADGVCTVCHSYDRVKVQAASYFGTRDDLVAIRDKARAERTGTYDAIHLLSGGKDSTYALYQLVDAGFDVLALTLDNGFISDGAKANARQSAADLGLDHEFMSTPAMNEIFRDSLERFSNVCNGCYKAIYTLATNRAVEVGAPVIVTGLSRGQLFETRLIPQQFSGDRFDVEAIDRAVVEARRAYHRTDDVPNRLLDTEIFAPGGLAAVEGTGAGAGEGSVEGDVFDRISYVDFYRYFDVELTEMLDFLDNSAPWVRPADTGRSTNCLINAAGIHSHLIEQGYHNYAEPYAWDVRLGHKTRDEALEELDDRDDIDEVRSMLAEIEYEPRPRQVLTAWVEVAEGESLPEPAELRYHLAGLLPAHAIPAAYVEIEQLPVTPNGKLDVMALPAPERVHRPGPALHVEATSDLERLIVERWERALKIEPVSATDDFFDLGGDSLMALEMIVDLGERLGVVLPEELAFANTTPRQLAEAVDLAISTGAVERDASGDTAPKPRAEGEEPPFSAGELSLLFQHLDAPDDRRYNICRLYRIESDDVDVDRFADALRTVVGRHVPLHWSFGFPRRQLGVSEALELVVDPSPGSLDEIRASAIARQSAPFDLENGPLVRCRIQPVAGSGSQGPSSVSIALVFHHISIDATSFDLLWSELEVAYRGDELPELDLDYGDVAAWHSNQQRDRAKQHWLSVNGGEPLPRPSWSDGEGGTRPGYVTRPIDIDRSSLAGPDGGTPFVTALCAIATVLGRSVEGDKVAVGMVGSTRDHVAARPLIGYFINPLPVVIDLSSPGPLVDRVSATVRTALSHRSYPYGAMVADRRRAGLDPLELPVLVALQETAPMSLGDAAVTQDVLGTGSSVAPVTLFLQLEGESVTLAVEYQAGTIENDDAAQVLLESIETELRARIGVAADPAPAPPATLHELIVAAAAASPDRAAVIAGGTTLTYGELVERAELVGAELQRAGSGPGVVVGLDASRRGDFAVGALAVLLTGAAYAPIEPTLPPARLATIIDEAGIEIVATADPSGTAWPVTTVVDLSLQATTPATASPFQQVEVDPSSPAYVLFTSGSTGTPKGVVVSHANIVATTQARAEYYPEPVDRFLVLSSFAFDSSAAGLYWALTEGGTVVLPDDGLHTEVTHLAKLIEQHRVTQLLALPSLHQLLLSENEADSLRSLRDVIVAGEECRPGLVDLHQGLLPDTRLHNEYGPTEAAVWSHVHTFASPSDGGEANEIEARVVPIGRPIPGASQLIVDDELWIGGAGVAIGYLGRPDLTNERFVERDGQRWYRTGDRVGVLDDGSLTFLGRFDDQVKLRGQRIEIGEIERSMETHPAVSRAAAAVVQPEGRPTPLVALWFEATRSVDADELRAHAESLLPDVMRPARFVPVDALPLNRNGKVDRSALRLDVETVAAPDIVTAMLGPANSPDLPLDQLAGLWAEALGLETVGLDDNYFDLGGDSIISIQIVARARKLGFALAPRDVFEHQTVRALARHLAATETPTIAPPIRRGVTDGGSPKGAAASSVGARATTTGTIPLTPIQHWLFDQDLPHLDHWTQFRWLDLAEDVDLDRLEAAARSLPVAHSALRHRFHTGAETTTITSESVDSDDLIGIERHDLGDTESPNWRAYADELASRIDITDGPTIRLATFIAGDRWRCVIVAHHLVVDGVSWSVLLDDWAEAYRTGTPAPAAGDIADWTSTLADPELHQTLRSQYSLWHEMLPLIPPSAPVATESEGRAVRRVLSVEETALLRRGGIQHALVAALAVGMASVMPRPSLDMIIEGHGREAEALASTGSVSMVDLSRTVGWCTSHHPVSIPLGNRESDQIRRSTNEVLAAIPDRGIGFGVGRSLDPTSGLVHRPLPDIVCGFLGRVDAASSIGDVFVGAEPMTTSIHPDNPRFHSLGLLAYLEGDRLHVEVDGTTHHEAGQLEALADAIMADLALQAAEAPLPPAAISPSLAGKRELVQLSSVGLRRLHTLLERSDRRRT